MTALFWDLETIPTSDPEVIAEIEANIKPPGNISKPETIAKWMSDNKLPAVEKAIHDTGLDGGLGKIICIGFAKNDDETDSFTQGDEQDIIRRLFGHFTEECALHYSGGTADNPPILVGHNILGFDLRFLYKRCVILGIKPPNRFPFDRQQQARGVVDTKLMWEPDRHEYLSLDTLCKQLGVPSPKQNMSGKDVWGFFKAGRIEEIAEYCRADVGAARECYKRMTFSTN
jgi:hypothetical protein